MLSLLLSLAVQTSDPFGNAAWLTVPVPAFAGGRAKWIWVQRPGEAVPSTANASTGTVKFVRTWRLSSSPLSAMVRFTADNSSRLRVNGKLVGSSSDWIALVEADVSKELKAGDNRIEVDATNDVATGDQNPAGFILIVEAKLRTGQLANLVTDGSWSSPDGKVVPLGAYDTEPWHLGPPDVPCPVFRREFSLHSRVRKAVARVVGLGHFDFYVNGKRQGDGLLNEPWSQYDKTIYWQEFDVTNSLRPGANAMGAELGNSYYRVVAPPSGRYWRDGSEPDFSGGKAPYLLRVVLDLAFADGHQEQVVTDGNWRWQNGPYVLSHVHAGEDYDARRFNPGWAQPGATGEWNRPVIAAKPAAELEPMEWPTLKAVQSWGPIETRQPKPGVWSYVFPQNASGILRFKVKGKRGATIKFIPSEVMTDAGEVQQLNLNGGEASGAYTLKGAGIESHEWRFFYFGFRYVELTGAVPAGQPNPRGLPVVTSLEMVHVRTDNAQVGEFHSSDELFNRTHDFIDWAIRSNMSYVMTDCPHREKLGWLECSHLLFSSFAYRYDARDWFRKITRDIREIQLADGRITTIAPDHFKLPLDNPFKFTVEWGAAGVLVPWQAYSWYGDRRFLTENYATMKRFVDYLDTHAVDGLAPEGLGDWYDYGHGQTPGPSRYTPTNLTSTAMWAMCAEAVAGSAEILGKAEDAAHYRAMHETIKAAFLRRFYDPATKTFTNSGSVQTGNAMALCAHFVPTEDRQAVLDAIVAELEKRGYQQTSGDVGHLFFIRAMAEGGRSDVLYKVYNRTGIGSYGGILAKGLTALPESWDALTVGGNSLNHCMLGHVMEWFYGWVLGIRQAPGSVGWKSILIAPEPGDSQSASGQTRTPNGVVSVTWTRVASAFSMGATVPRGATALMVLPVQADVLELDGVNVAAKKGPFGRGAVEVGPGQHVLKTVLLK